MTPQAPGGFTTATVVRDPSHPIPGHRSTLYAQHDPAFDTVLFTRNMP